MLTYATAFAIVSVPVATLFVYRKFIRSRKEWPKDTVVLHQIGRGPWAPSVSPFPLKLETYLRMSNIPYVNDQKGTMSSKGKTPWISYNNEVIADSQFCIEYLNKKFDVDLSKHLTKEQRAVATAFQKLAEDNLYWPLVLLRWYYDKTKAFVKSFIKPIVKFQFIANFLAFVGSRIVWRQAWSQGMGRHSKEDVITIAEKDMKALSDFIGDKPFLMGDEPCEQDCAIFGMLSQCCWHMPGSCLETIANNTFPNLRDYCNRMKDRIWPDWDECITHGYTRKASK